MKDLLIYLTTQLVDHPEAIVVDEITEEGKTVLTLHVHPEDMGRIIGKSGRIIKAIRDLVKIVAAKRDTYIDVILAEEDKIPSESESIEQ